MKMFLTALALLAITTPNAKASEVNLDVYGVSYTNSCQYYSQTMGEYDVTLVAWSLKWGTKITVISGWKGTEATPEKHAVSWYDRSETVADAVAPYTWRARITKTLHQRSSPVHLTDLQFVLKIEEPGRAVRYLNGGMAWSYYQAPAFPSFGSPCIGSGAEKPEMAKIPHHIVTGN